MVFATHKVYKPWEETTWREVYIVAYYEQVKRLQDIYIDQEGLVQKKELEDKLIEIAKGYGFVIDHIEPEDWYERNQWVFAICVERQQEWIKGIASTSIPKEGSRLLYFLIILRVFPYLFIIDLAGHAMQEKDNKMDRKVRSFEWQF